MSKNSSSRTKTKAPIDKKKYSLSSHLFSREMRSTYPIKLLDARYVIFARHHRS
ncbi:MAG: hypothetical protein ACTSWN_01750 [Promethearchaeota archaeon]